MIASFLLKVKSCGKHKKPHYYVVLRIPCENVFSNGINQVLVSTFLAGD